MMIESALDDVMVSGREKERERQRANKVEQNIEMHFY